MTDNFSVNMIPHVRMYIYICCMYKKVLEGNTEIHSLAHPKKAATP